MHTLAQQKGLLGHLARHGTDGVCACSFSCRVHARQVNMVYTVRPHPSSEPRGRALCTRIGSSRYLDDDVALKSINIQLNRRHIIGLARMGQIYSSASVRAVVPLEPTQHALRDLI